MFGSSILDLAIGMAFIYLLLSLIASTVQEAIASVLQIRPANLEHGIRSLFSGGKLATDVAFVDRLYRHGLIMGLYRENVDAAGTISAKLSPVRNFLRRFFRVHPTPPIPGVSDPFTLPSYIPARTFALAMVDILKTESERADPPLDIGDYLKSLCDQQKAIDPNTTHAAAEAMLALFADAQTVDGITARADKFRCHLENWYNDAMDRASGWYKKYTQNVLLCIGLLLAILLNVDSIHVGKTLWFDKDARQGLISAASSYVDKHTVPPKAAPQPGEATLTEQALTDQMKTTVSAFNKVSEDYMLPVGWHYSLPEYRYHVTHPQDWRVFHILEQVTGWLITALALSLGAPFWFDTLNKFMVVRSTVKPQEKSRNESSKDG